jgi:23S rRNA (guanine2445-N2)-methyltransferase / 23S rRNA (guanine2069-N7)-methyltransferase
LHWRGHDAALWEKLVKEAQEKRQQALRGTWPVIIGYDADGSAVQAAGINIKKAGLQKVIRVEQRELAAFDGAGAGRSTSAAAKKIVIVNPPYGERLEAEGPVKYLYRCLGRKLKQHCAGWQAGVFTSSVELADALGMQPLRKHRLFNGPLPCQLYLYDVPQAKDEPRGPALEAVAVSETDRAQDFANRLQKNMHRLLPRAKREGVSCVRIYDADMPEYNMAVDIYEQWAHVQEYAPPKTVDPGRAEQRMRESLRVIQQVLGIRRSQLFIKIRQRQKGSRQYQQHDTRGRLFEVREGPCRLLVNLTDYIDTGLFLDHRITRGMIGAGAAGRRFLNLFGYTGTATVHAALGGARWSITVDRSPAYCAWARSNLMLNGFSSEQHRVIRADCMQWLEGCHDRFDLVFADPPTFSNRKSTESVFDVQRDHVAFIKRIMGCLAPDGLLIFSTNYRRFQLDGQALAGLRITDISAATIPFDFQRNQRVHQCWEIRHQ